uniref:RNA helicase n=1 Tax=Loa loa TaxID=7209 RepID=A0A1I7W469_LOALO
MSGGFGRGKIFEQEVDSSYFPKSHFAPVGDGIEENRYGSSDVRSSFHRDSFSRGSNFDEYNRENTMERVAGYNRGFSSEFDTGDYVGNRRGSHSFTRGGRGGSFSGDHEDGNGYLSGRENQFTSDFSTGCRGGLSSRYGGRDSGFLAGSAKNRGSSSSGGRGGGFGASGSLNDGHNFDTVNHTGGRRGNSFGTSNYDDGSGGFANHSSGFRSGRAFSSNRVGDFRFRSDFDSDRDESFDKFGNKYDGFSSRRDTRGFGSSYNNGRFEGSSSRANTEETSFGARNSFNSGFNSEGRIGFGHSNFSTDWSGRRNSGRGNQHFSGATRGTEASFGNRVSRDGVGPRFSSHIPEDRPVEEMYGEDAENAKYEISDLDQEVTVTGVPQLQKLLKLDDWKNAGFGDLLLRNIIKKSFYSVPRRIQAAVIPLIQNGWDIVGQAETGSGKTAAFILPIINHIMNNGEPTDSKCAPIALIIAPTRELVGQLYNQARKFADGTGVTTAKAYGQYKLMENVMELERGCNMLFATMGRLKDFVERGKVKLHNISFFVLDEADRMLGQDAFQTDIMCLIQRPDFPSINSRQTLLFSATFTPEVQELAAKLLKKDHAFISNGKITAANPLVEQNFIEVTSENKFDKLIQLLEEDRENNGDVARTLVFVQRKQMADVIALNLIQKNIRSSSVSGDRVQKQREEALADFRKGNIKVLVATDVCARGIDVKDLQHVINYDMPNDRVTYVHRIGRTGRLLLIGDIVKVVQEVQQIPPDFLLDFANGRIGRGGYMGRQRSDVP